MIRAMIGTVAVLAGFAVVERSMIAGNGQGGTCTAPPAASECSGVTAPGCTSSTPAPAPSGSTEGSHPKPVASTECLRSFSLWPDRKRP